MQYVGHPIINDRLYSSDRDDGVHNYNSITPVLDEENNRLVYKDNVYLKYVKHLLKLHAYQVVIKHPMNNTSMTINTADAYLNSNKMSSPVPFNTISGDPIDPLLISKASDKLLAMDDIW